MRLLAGRGPTGKFVPKMEGVLTFPGAEALPVKIPEFAPIPAGYFEKFADRVIETGASDFLEITPPADVINLTKQIEPASQQQGTDVERLERSFSTFFFDTLPPREKEIIEEAIGECLTAREVYRRLKITKDECLQMFVRWQELGIGKQRIAGQTVYFDI